MRRHKITIGELREKKKELEEKGDTQSYRKHSEWEIEKALKATCGYRSQAAKLLGIDRSTLYRRMQRLNLS